MVVPDVNHSTTTAESQQIKTYSVSSPSGIAKNLVEHNETFIGSPELFTTFASGEESHPTDTITNIRKRTDNRFLIILILRSLIYYPINYISNIFTKTLNAQFNEFKTTKPSLIDFYLKYGTGELRGNTDNLILPTVSNSSYSNYGAQITFYPLISFGFEVAIDKETTTGYISKEITYSDRLNYIEHNIYNIIKVRSGVSYRYIKLQDKWISPALYISTGIIKLNLKFDETFATDKGLTKETANGYGFYLKSGINFYLAYNIIIGMDIEYTYTSPKFDNNPINVDGHSIGESFKIGFYF